MPKTAHNIIGMIYDFDGTLSPHNMQEDTIFRAYRIDKDKLWAKARRLMAEKGYERTLAYLKLLIHERAFRHKPLNREYLRRLAAHIKYSPGVTSFFPWINRFVAAIPEVREWGITLEHYVISSGMKEILEGTKIYRFFKRVYACEYEYENGSPVFPKLVINDTNKTQFLFRINKGKLDLADDINTHMPEERRRIPFRNLIYIGDSATDIPSMTVVHKYGGHAIAVFDPAGDVTEVVKDLVAARRVDHFAPADFRKGSLLARILERTLKKIIHTIGYYGSARMSLDWVRRHRAG